MLKHGLFGHAAGKQWDAMVLGKEQRRFVSLRSAVFVQSGLDNVLTVQVPDKLARETLCECGKTDVCNLL